MAPVAESRAETSAAVRTPNRTTSSTVPCRCRLDAPRPDTLVQSLQVLQALPDGVATAMLRAALAVTPLHVRAGPCALAGRHRHNAEARAHPVRTLLAILPPAFHPALLQAHAQPAHLPRSLTLPPCDPATATAAIHAVSRSFGTQLNSLTLQGIAPPARCDASCAAMVAELEAVWAPLASMTAIERLSISTPKEESTLEWVDAHVQGIASAFPALPHLTLLRLTLLMDDTRTVAALSAHLPALRTLRVLDLRDCGLGGGPCRADMGGLDALGTALGTLRALTYLSLALNPLGSAGWAALAPAAGALPLVALDLEACKLYDPFALHGGTAAGAGAAFAQLQQLQLSGNRLRNPAVHLSTGLPRLTQLQMSGLPLFRQAEERLLRALLAHESARLQVLALGDLRCGPAVADVLCQGVQRWTALHTLSLEWHPHATAPLPRLLPRLAALPCLQALEMRRLCVKDESDVPEELGACTGLTRLKIAEMRCGCDASRALARSLAALTQLRSVEVTGKDETFGAGGGAALATALHSLKLVTRLKLRRVFRAADANQLMQGLACMQSLRDLSLADNGIGPAEMTALVPVLGTLRVLRRLDLGGNRMQYQGAAALAAAMPCMSALRELYLRGCNLSDAAKRKVVFTAQEGMQVIDLSQ